MGPPNSLNIEEKTLEVSKTTEIKIDWTIQSGTDAPYQLSNISGDYVSLRPLDPKDGTGNAIVKINLPDNFEETTFTFTIIFNENCGDDEYSEEVTLPVNQPQLTASLGTLTLFPAQVSTDSQGEISLTVSEEIPDDGDFKLLESADSRNPGGIRFTFKEQQTSDELLFDFEVDKTARLSTRKIYLQHGDTGRISNTADLKIKAGSSTAETDGIPQVILPPNISKIHPLILNRGKSTTLTIEGTNLNGCKINFANIGITAGTIKVLSPGSFTTSVFAEYSAPYESKLFAVNGDESDSADIKVFGHPIKKGWNAWLVILCLLVVQLPFLDSYPTFFHWLFNVPIKLDAIILTILGILVLAGIIYLLCRNKRLYTI